MKYCPPREGNTENQLFQYYPTVEENIDIFNIYWSDNIKARLINNNSKSRITNKKRFNSQEKMYDYYSFEKFRNFISLLELNRQ